jgi:uncharacterized membrane protein YdbT with pleckstrin-like domain
LHEAGREDRAAEVSMGYVDSNLLKDEQLVRRGVIHWAIFSPAIFLGAFGLLGLAASSGFAVFLVISVLLVISEGVLRSTTEMAITNKRVIMKRGWISRKTLELNLNKIENLGIDQGLLGRMLNYGTVTVVGTGGTRETFKYVAQPIEFRKTVQDLSH